MYADLLLDLLDAVVVISLNVLVEFNLKTPQVLSDLGYFMLKVSLLQLYIEEFRAQFLVVSLHLAERF